MNNEHKREFYTCKRYRLLTYLRMKGFVPYDIIPEATNPKFLNWRFHNTPELQDALTEYFEQFK